MTDTQRDVRGAWLGFSLKGQRYALSLTSVREVIRPNNITPVPGAPDDVLGIVNLRGQIVPVLDGRRRFGLEGVSDTDAEAEDAQRVIVFDEGGTVVGMRIDVIGEMLTFDADEVSPPPAGRAQRRDDPVSGVITRDDGFIALVDVQKLCRT
jgi:purine-binding chemotaxis protein CheW